MKISKILLFHFFLSVAATGATAQSQDEQCADLIFKADYHRTYFYVRLLLNRVFLQRYFGFGELQFRAMLMHSINWVLSMKMAWV